MTTTAVEARAVDALAHSSHRINDIVIKIATPNGSGSQSANLILMRSFFELGLPVSAKNLFPSNIQGLPTWFTVRVNEAGWLAACNRIDLFVAMNPDTLIDDVGELEPGAMLIVDKALRRLVKRDDLDVYAVPFTELVNQVCEVARLRKMVVNIIYVGVIAALLGMSAAPLHKAVDWQFAKKPSAAELNKAAITAGYDWARKHLEPQERFVVQPSDAARGKIIIEGNEAMAIGMMMGGVTVASWYPITPSSSLCEALQTYLDRHRRDPASGKATYAVVQAEDEIAALSMVLGAGWAGARAFTSTSGPGISLMAELTGLAYFAEIPAVVVDVQRMGPSTGLPTRTSQGDILKAYNLSHGDCKHVVLIPGDVRECYEFAQVALDLAEQLQTIVFILSDLDLGMNKSLSDPFEYPERPLRRGKVLSAEDLDRNGDFARYRDVDGDGIPYRTVPGTMHAKAGYFTRGTGHTEKAAYSESPAVWKANMDRLLRKFETARGMTPKPVSHRMEQAEVGILAYGSSGPAVEEARHLLASRHGLPTDYLRVRALPLSAEVRDFVAAHPYTYVVEQNRDAQLVSILRDEYPQLATRLRSVLHYNGFPLDADTVVSAVRKYETMQKGQS